MMFCRCHQCQHPAKVNPPCSLTTQSRVRPSATSLSSYLQTKFQRQQNACILIPRERRSGCKGCCFHRITLGFVCQGGDFSRGNGTSGKCMQGEKSDDANFFLKHSLASCPWQILGQYKKFHVSLVLSRQSGWIAHVSKAKEGIQQKSWSTYGKGMAGPARSSLMSTVSDSNQFDQCIFLSTRSSSCSSGAHPSTLIGRQYCIIMLSLQFFRVNVFPSPCRSSQITELGL